MAKTGSITITQGTYSIPNNTTTITVTGRIVTTGESYRGNHRTGTITVTQDGTVIYSGTFTHGAPANSTTTLFTIPLKVNHYSNGTSGTIEASYNYDSGWCSARTSKILTTIPRYASIISAPNFNDEGNPSIEYSNPAGGVVTSLQACISLTGEKDDVPYRNIDKNGTTYTFNLTNAERETLRLATTGSNSRSVKFRVKTLLAGTAYQDQKTVTFSILNGKPTLSPTVVDVNEETIALTGDANILVRNQSNATVNSGAQVYKGATINSQKVICGNKGLSQGSGTIKGVSSGAFVFSVTDNRKNTVTQTVNAPFVEYVNLTCNLDANPPDAEGDMTFHIKGNYFAGTFGAVDNAIKVYYKYKANSEEYGKWVEVSEVAIDSNENTYVATVSLNGLDYQNKYTFQTMSSDALMKVTSAEKIVKTVPVFDWGERDFNFNVPVKFSGGIAQSVLYENEAGSTSAITLSETSANFKYLEIYFQDYNGKGGGYRKIYSPNGKSVYLDLVEPSSANSTYIRRTGYQISDNLISPNTTTAGYWLFNGSTHSHNCGTNYIKITRVVACR